jgi:hypothetical protein
LFAQAGILKSIFFKRIFPYTVIAVALFSCTFGKEQVAPSRAELARQRLIDNTASGVAVEPFTSTEQGAVSHSPDNPGQFGIELTWEVPPDPVESFVLYTGSNPGLLGTELHVSLSDLAVVEGNKYRYVVKPVIPGEPFYVSLAAVRKGVLSEKSPALRIETGIPPAFQEEIMEQKEN